MTSNAGASVIKKQHSIGFERVSTKEDCNNEYEKMKEVILSEVKKCLSQSF